jgi:hypothetical protein
MRLVALLSLLARLALPAISAQLAIDISDSPGTTVADWPVVLGYAFGTTQQLQTTALGVFDDSGDGLSSAHAVGLWDSSGDLLASALVPAGTAAELVDRFRLVRIAPITLESGEAYRVGALFASASDNVVFDATALATAPGITYIHPAYTFNEGLVDPTEIGFGRAYFGANVLVSAAPVPEPSSLLLIIPSAAIMLLRKRFIRP